MPLTPEEQQELQALMRLEEDSRTESEKAITARSMAGAGGGGIPVEVATGQKEPLGIEGIVPPKVLSAVSEYGIPIGAGIASGGRSALQQAMIGLLAGGAGKVGSRLIEGKDVLSKEGAKETIAGGVESMVPGFKGAYLPLKTGAAAGGAGLASAAIRGELEPTLISELKYGAAPTALGVGAGALQSSLGKFAKGAAEGAKAAEEIERIGPGVKPTLGQSIRKYAGLEARVSSQVGREELAKSFEAQNQAIASAVERIAGGPRGQSLEMVRNALEGMDVRDRTELLNAASNVTNAEDALKLVRGGARQQVVEDSLEKAQKRLENAVTQKMLGKSRIVGQRPEYSGVFKRIEAGTQIEEATRNAKKAFSDRSEQLYQPTKPFENTPGFDLLAPVGKDGLSVGDQIMQAFKSSPIYANGQIIPEFTPFLGKLKSILDSRSPASLAELREIRADLYKAADSAGEAFGTKSQNDLKQVARKITETLDQQADAVLGPTAASDLRTANKFYADFRPQFEGYGVESAFMRPGEKPGKTAGIMAEEIAKEGLASPGYANLSKLLQGLKSAGAANVPDVAPIKSLLREGVIDQAIVRSGGKVIVDFKRLSDVVDQIESQTPGALKELGIGSRKDLNTLMELKEFSKGEPGVDAIVKAIKSNSDLGTALGSRMLPYLTDVTDIQSVMKALQTRAIGSPGVAGNQAARDALLDIKANEINDLLLQATKLGKAPRLEALSDFLNEDQLRRYRNTIGSPMLRLIETRILPGFKRIEQARQAARQAGSTVTGAAEERLVGGLAQAPVTAATRGPVSAIGDMVGNWMSLVKYDVLSKILARSGGSTGFRNAEKQLQTLNRQITGQPTTQAIRILENYAFGAKTPEPETTAQP